MTKAEAIKKVLSLASNEVGYAAKTGKENKFGQYLDNLKNFYNGKKTAPGWGADWCDIFVDAIFTQAFGNPTGRLMLYQPEKSLGAGCPYSARYYKNNKAWTTTPQKGAQIFFGTPGDEYHTGIVEDVDARFVYTIEGNAGGGNGKVKRCTYYRTANFISGYGIPNWSLVAKSAPDPEPAPAPSPLPDYAKLKPGTTYTVKAGDTLTKIAALYGTTVPNLAKINGIKNVNVISVGQKLVIKPAETATTKKTVLQIAQEVIDGKWGNGLARVERLKNAGYNPTEVQAKVNELLSKKEYYTVKRGDTLSAIAKKYKTTTAQLAKWNGIKNVNLITTGQILRVK